MVVPSGYEYYIDSFNTYHVYAIVPYSTYQYRVEVLYPVSEDSLPTEVVKPAVTLKDFREWVQSADMLVRDENDIMYQVAKLLIEIAREIIEYDEYDNPKMFVRAVCYYVAHNLELHIKALKDEENRMSLNVQSKPETQDSDQTKQISLVDNHYGDFKKTLWGQMFWTVYGHNAKFTMTGVF